MASQFTADAFHDYAKTFADLALFGITQLPGCAYPHTLQVDRQLATNPPYFSDSYRI